jgi:predicted enzyme related to lactoylglutathione lyase
MVVREEHHMTVSGVTATYYSVQDLARATAFYTELLGVPPTAAIPDAFSEWVFADDTAFGLYNSGNFRASDGVMFVVDDVPAAIAELKARGVAVSDHIEETPVCWMGFASDTEGNGFILHKHKS